MRLNNHKYTDGVFGSLLVIAVLVAYSKVFQAGFISWDDADYVLNNPDIRNVGTGVANWFSKFYIGNYHPLTILSYAIDFAIGGEDPWIYHTTNILLHAANAVLVYALFTRLLDQKEIALVISLLFALHPVQTESVSWIAERKNVLFGFFFLLALYSYVAYATEESYRKLALVILAGIAAMLSKAAAVTLPLTLVAIDIALQRPLNNRKVWLEKLPLMLIAVIVGVVAINAQREGAFLNLHPEFTLGHTAVYAGYAYTAYITQLLLPLKLSVLYPYPAEVSAIHFIFSAITIGILALGFVAYRKNWQILCAGIVFYTVNIAIVLQFVQFGEVLMANRYAYIACLGIWLPLIYYLFVFFAKTGKQNVAIVVSTVVTLCFWGLTYARNNIWLSELNFWNAIVNTFPNSSVAQNSVGGVYLKMQNYPEALEHVEHAIQTDPNNYKAWYNKGVIHLRKGEAEQAQASLDRAISINEYPKALFTRAMLFQQYGQTERALIDVEKVLLQEPGNARAYFIKASCMEQLNNAEVALESYTKAIAYEGNEPLFYTRRGALNAKTGQNAAAMSDLSMAISLKNNAAEAWYWRGLVKHNLGKEACGDLNEARKLGYKDAVPALMKLCNTD